MMGFSASKGKMIHLAHPYEKQLLYSMCERDGKLYACTGVAGLLLEFDGISSWICRAKQFEKETIIFSLCVYKNEIYGASFPSGYLLKWNEKDLWIKVAGSFDKDNFIYSLLASDSIYGGTVHDSQLYRWNEVDMWEKVADFYDSKTEMVSACKFKGEATIRSLCMLDGQIYAGTTPSGLLLRWDSKNLTWILMANRYKNETGVSSLQVINGEIYCIGLLTGDVLKWDGTVGGHWNSVGPESTKIATNHHVMCEADGKIVQLKSINACNSMWSWDGVTNTLLVENWGPDDSVNSIVRLNNIFYIATNFGNLYSYAD